MPEELSHPESHRFVPRNARLQMIAFAAYAPQLFRTHAGKQKARLRISLPEGFQITKGSYKGKRYGVGINPCVDFHIGRKGLGCDTSGDVACETLLDFFPVDHLKGAACGLCVSAVTYQEIFDPRKPFRDVVADGAAQ